MSWPAKSAEQVGRFGWSVGVRLVLGSPRGIIWLDRPVSRRAERRWAACRVRGFPRGSGQAGKPAQRAQEGQKWAFCRAGPKRVLPRPAARVFAAGSVAKLARFGGPFVRQIEFAGRGRLKRPWLAAGHGPWRTATLTGRTRPKCRGRRSPSGTGSRRSR